MADAHYFTAAPPTVSRPSTVELALPDATITLGSDRGVFAAQRVDHGTVVLLREVPTTARRGDLLDLGCGYGPIAVTLARRAPEATVWAVDTNTRAVALAAANGRRLGLPNLRAVTPDGVPADLRFREIWSNPPIRIGKDALHALLEQWLARLEPDGRAVLVVHKHLGSDSLTGWLSAGGRQVIRLGSKQGYRLLEVRPPSAPPPVLPGQPVRGRQG